MAPNPTVDDMFQNLDLQALKIAKELGCGSQHLFSDGYGDTQGNPIFASDRDHAVIHAKELSDRMVATYGPNQNVETIATVSVQNSKSVIGYDAHGVPVLCIVRAIIQAVDSRSSQNSASYGALAVVYALYPNGSAPE